VHRLSNPGAVCPSSVPPPVKISMRPILADHRQTAVELNQPIIEKSSPPFCGQNASVHESSTYSFLPAKGPSQQTHNIDPI